VARNIQIVAQIRMEFQLSFSFPTSTVMILTKPSKSIAILEVIILIEDQLLVLWLQLIMATLSQTANGLLDLSEKMNCLALLVNSQPFN